MKYFSARRSFRVTYRKLEERAASRNRGTGFAPEILRKPATTHHPDNRMRRLASRGRDRRIHIVGELFATPLNEAVPGLVKMNRHQKTGARGLAGFDGIHDGFVRFHNAFEAGAGHWTLESSADRRLKG